MARTGNIIRNIGSSSTKTAKHIHFLATEGNLNFNSVQEVVIQGKENGLKFGDFTEDKGLNPITDLQIVKMEGPFDENWNEVEFVEKSKFYNYKAIPNRKLKPHEILLLKWDREYDDNGEFKRLNHSGNLLHDGNIGIGFAVGTQTEASKLSIYAYFQKRSNKAKVETDILINETIIIVGTEQSYTNPANKLMFPAQAVRLIKNKLSKHPNLDVLIFKDGYTEKQLSAITKAITNYNKKSRVIHLKSVSEVINFFNYGQRDGNQKRYPYRKISEIYIYSHGYVRSNNEGVIAFGYEGKNAATQELDISHFNKINNDVFLEKNLTIMYSYACRTGIGTASESATNPQKNNSLAKKIANKGKIVVYAYMRRSLYEDTWGSQLHRHTYASDNDAGDSKFENFKSDVKDAFTTDPSDMSNYNNYRKNEVKIDGAIWNPSGAYSGVKAGDWPPGVPSTFDLYKPD